MKKSLLPILATLLTCLTAQAWPAPQKRRGHAPIAVVAWSFDRCETCGATATYAIEVRPGGPRIARCEQHRPGAPGDPDYAPAIDTAPPPATGSPASGFYLPPTSGYVNPDVTYVHGYYRNGRYVSGHYRTKPNGTTSDNFSHRGNV